MRNNPHITDALIRLGLNKDEVSIYLSLLRGQKNHLDVSRETGVARSTVYRLVDSLIDKGIVHEVTTAMDEKLLESAPPQTLELLVVQQEATAANKRQTFQQLLPMLTRFVNQDETFSIKSYRGIQGLKQMLWNELGTKNDICLFNSGSLNSALGKSFAEKFRSEVIKRGITQRIIKNIEATPTNTDYAVYYNQMRFIAKEILHIKTAIAIHDEIVFIYNNWEEDTQIGTEIKNPLLASFMRQVFEHYWKLTETKKDYHTR